MLTYTGDSSSFHSEISIFEAYDLVLGDIDGTSNVPVKELADNSAYLKKYKGNVLKGTGIPSDAVFPVGFVVDSNTNTNTLYLDQLTGSFWKRTGTNTWQNIGKGAVLNVKGIRLNDNGDDANTVLLTYNSSSGYLELRNNADTDYADLRVGTLRYDSADGSTGTMSSVIDKEIVLLSNITSNSYNTDAYFSVKNLVAQPGVIDAIKVFANHTYDRFYVSVSPTVVAGDLIQVDGVAEETDEHINRFYKVASVQTTFPYYIEVNRSFELIDSVTDKTALSGEGLGTYSKDNSAQLRWDNTNERFELRRRDGTLLPINVSKFFINGVPTSFTANRIIANQADFDELFNVLSNAGTNECYLRSPESGYVNSIENEYIFVKKCEDPDSGQEEGSYTLDKTVVIEGNNVTIEFAPGTIIRYRDTLNNPTAIGQGGNICFRYRNYTDHLIEQFLRTVNDNTLAIKSSNYGYVSGPFANVSSATPDIEPADRIFCFSDNLDMCRKFTVSTHSKEILNTLADSPVSLPYDGGDIDLGGPFDMVIKEVDGNLRLFVAWVRSTGASNIVFLRSYAIDYSGTTFVTPGTTFRLQFTVSIFSPDELKIIIGDTRGVVVATAHTATGATELCYKQFNIDSPEQTPVSAVHYSTDLTSDNLYGINGCILNDTDLYIVGNQASAGKIRIFKATLTSLIDDSDTSPLLVHSVDTCTTSQKSNIYKVGCATVGGTVYVSFGYLETTDTATHYLILCHGSGNTWTESQASFTGDTYAGIYSDIVIADNPNSTGNKLAHILFTTGSDDLLMTEQVVLAVVDIDGAFSFTRTVLSEDLTGYNFTNVSILNNTGNYYKSASQIVCSAVRQSPTNQVISWSYINNFGVSNLPTKYPILNSSARAKFNWARGDLTKLILLGANNDAGFFCGLDDSTTEVFMQRFEFVNVLAISETLPLGVTEDVVVSNDYIENCQIRNLVIKQMGTTSGPSYPFETGAFVEVANGVNCKITGLKILNGQYDRGIFGGAYSISTDPLFYPKTHLISINDVWIDDSNTIATSYLEFIDNSVISNFLFGQSTGPTYQFKDCKNISVSGFLNNNDSIFGTGDFLAITG